MDGTHPSTNFLNALTERPHNRPGPFAIRKRFQLFDQRRDVVLRLRDDGPRCRELVIYGNSVTGGPERFDPPLDIRQVLREPRGKVRQLLRHAAHKTEHPLKAFGVLNAPEEPTRSFSGRGRLVVGRRRRRSYRPDRFRSSRCVLRSSGSTVEVVERKSWNRKHEEPPERQRN